MQIAPRRGRASLEALACVGNIAKAMGPAMEPHVRGLLDIMISAGLSLTLVDALEQMTIRYEVFFINLFSPSFSCDISYLKDLVVFQYTIFAAYYSRSLA